MNKTFYTISTIVLVTIGFLFVSFSVYTMIQTKDNYIPRGILFGNPEKSQGAISPDGVYVSYLANGQTPETQGVKNVWIQSLDTGEHTQVTFDTSRGIHEYFWRKNGQEILYFQDQDGDENWQLFGVRLSDGITKAYTPAGAMSMLITSSSLHPDALLVALNDEDPERFDVYRIDLKTGERICVEKGMKNVCHWYGDSDLNLRAAFVLGEEGVQLLVKEEDGWQPHLRWDYESQRSTRVLGCNRDGSVLFLKDSIETDTAQLVAYSIKGRTKKVIFSDPDYDVEKMLYNEETDTIEAVAVERERFDWHVLDRNCEAAFASFKQAADGDMRSFSRSHDGKKWFASVLFDTSMPRYYLYDENVGQTKLIFSSHPALDEYQLAPVRPITYTSSDGLLIHGYLTLPVGYEPAKNRKPLPLVLRVHGGPQMRDSWDFHPEVQWLANRGYAVLQVNYRGSLGYGKKFLTAAYKEWGGKMHQDLLDAVQWAIDDGIADPQRIAIYGGSYGGYAALCGATKSSDTFCCAVDIFGISNLVSFLDTIPPYWEMWRPMLYKEMGHPEHDRELLLERSPLTHVDEIRCPILIVQGDNDPRVKRAESEQIVDALKARDLPHEYLLFDDEGHGFVRPENRLRFFGIAEKFLAEHLGGEYRG